MSTGVAVVAMNKSIHCATAGLLAAARTAGAGAAEPKKAATTVAAAAACVDAYQFEAVALAEAMASGRIWALDEPVPLALLAVGSSPWVIPVQRT